MGINYEAEVQETTSNENLAEIERLVRRIREAEQDVELAEQQLKASKARLRQLEEVDLPTKLDEVNLSEIVTTAGLKVTIKSTLYASIAKKNKRAAAEWLIANGHGSLVSEDLSVKFAKGDTEAVHRAITALTDAGIAGVEISENMNTTSIKALINELTADGVDVPLDLFGAHYVRKAVIK